MMTAQKDRMTFVRSCTASAFSGGGRLSARAVLSDASAVASILDAAASILDAARHDLRSIFI